MFKYINNNNYEYKIKTVNHTLIKFVNMLVTYVIT